VTPNLIFELTRDDDRFFGQGFIQVNGQAMVLA
jgi:hypothetical protein